MKIDLFSNEPPKDFSGPAIVESMSDSSTEEADGAMVLCSRCKVNIILAELKEKLLRATIPQQSSVVAMTPQKVLEAGQRQKVFDRLGSQAQNDKSPPVRRRYGFDAPFYNEDYYVHNSSSLSSSSTKRTFKSPEPHDQR
ncbi:hypothetical protein ACFX2H_013469 [Malus domestica]